MKRTGQRMDREKRRILMPMTAAVEYHDELGGGGWVWRTIAAFDVDAVAESYAAKGNAEKPGRYRVRRFFT